MENRSHEFSWATKRVESSETAHYKDRVSRTWGKIKGKSKVTRNLRH